MLTITHPGRVHLALDLAHGHVEVHVEDTRKHAEVTLTPMLDSDTTAARLIADALVTETGDQLSVTVPRPSTPYSSATVIQPGRVVVQTFSGVVFGTNIVNGRVISGTDTAVVQTGGGVRIVARLPLGSTLAVVSETAPVVATGHLRSLRFHSLSGDLTAHSVDNLDVDTTSGYVSVAYAGLTLVHSVSGDVEVGEAFDVLVSTTSGDVDVAELVNTARVRTVSGDISVHAVQPSSVDANSVSGDISLNSGPGVLITSRTRTVSGRVRNRAGRA
ncbi:DUF4097 domain-containing protein [Lentzea tibetensis]|uniref:DUF4097 domain-containing protein n=1 Tax=Lentzea tibetensis TaxID=2591470 RepID=A0A563EV49_9PSEU|nr:DUF4097 family beta strand repeat-containing protein [Lentzea tibetensis]TWP51523.1 DUF4097 domain-containing protein [Lentzea tibetensis]